MNIVRGIFCGRTSPDEAPARSSKIVKGATIGAYILGIGALMGALYFGVHGLHPGVVYPLAFKATLIGGSASLLTAVALTVYSCSRKSIPNRTEDPPPAPKIKSSPPPKAVKLNFEMTAEEIDGLSKADYRNLLFTLSQEIEKSEGEVSEEIREFLPNLVNRRGNALTEPKGCVRLADHLDQVHPVLFVKIYGILSNGEKNILNAKLQRNEKKEQTLVELTNRMNIQLLMANQKPMNLDGEWDQFGASD